jgi:adenosine/AMP kinase
LEEKVKLDVVEMTIPDECNIIVGQSHFIKTVDDMYEALVTTSPYLEFGIAFNEASGPCLIRKDGNAEDLIEAAVENAKRIGAGHVFVVLLRKGYPINVLNKLKSIQEVCRIYAATANPLQIIVAETGQGRGVMGVIDGASPKGVEGQEDIEARKKLLRDIIGYKR